MKLAVGLFFVLRGFNIYGNPWPWERNGGFVKSLLSFLSTNKYPASLQFLLSSHGPHVAPPQFLSVSSASLVGLTQ